MNALVCVFIGGGIGSVFRYSLSLLVSSPLYPKATFYANVISCLILGMLLHFFKDHFVTDPTRLLLITGFCGGFSTFSTFSAEMITLYQSGHLALAIGYGVLSMIAGLVSILIGLYIAQFF